MGKKDRKRSHSSDRHRKSSRKKSKSKSKSKSKRERKQSSSSSSSSRSSSTSRSASPAPSHTSVKLLKTLEDRRIQDHLERKRQKEEMKANESLEEKRARRLREKEAKEMRRRQRMGWDTEYQHYTNQDNPFGDSNLMSSFVWNKKLEKEGLNDVPLETVEVLSRHKQIENKLELEKVKKRRLEREQERQAREEEMVMQQRSKEAAQFQEWERQEDQFHLEQARLRSVIRIQDGRAKPIDLLAQYLSSSKLEDAIEVQMHEPYVLLNGLSVKDLEDLLIDIKVYIELEKGNNSDFWDDMTVIVQDELSKLQKQEAERQLEGVGGRREGIHQNVVKDVSDIFRGKNAAQLDELRKRIESKINERNDGVDISYWESLLSQLNAHMARARLRDRHQESLRQKLKMLKSTSDDEDLPSTSVDALSKLPHSENSQDEGAAYGGSGDANAFDVSDLVDNCFDLYEKGNYSPQYLHSGEIDDSIAVIAEQEYDSCIDRLRAQYMGKLQEDTLSQEELQMHCEARKGMLADEVEFSVEATLAPTTHLASDKYRPRKPRYFNRVHTGFEWNKYNQTHYDMDNPPPKIVQGYKFNIFYPDLINKSSTPQYFLTPCADNSDFAILRFHAGPPYEDIAFKIVNREWEFSYKRGFRCQFHNNIFQLWFHFKRYRYRR